MTVSKSISSDLLDTLLSDYQKPEDLLGENGLLKQLTKALVERALEAELTDHLGHAKHHSVTHLSGNTRNGKSKKTLKGEFGELPIEIPRDRQGQFEPQLIPKHHLCPWVNPLGRVRRQDHLSLCAGHDGSGNSKPPGRTVWRRGLAIVDFLGHGCGR